jgi:hypothetical protein
MSKSKYKITAGLHYVITTGEPVFVKAVGDGAAICRRPVVGQDGLRYVEESFPVEELETKYEQVRRNIDVDLMNMELRQEAEERLYKLQEADLLGKQPQAKNPSAKMSLDS